MDLDVLESFLVLVQERHYGRAAEVRHLSSPTLSKHVQRLERQLGVRVLDRDPSGVLALTEAGTRLAAQAGALLEHERTLQRVAQGRVATVVLGVPSDGEGGRTSAGFTAVVRRLVRQQHPDVALVCRGTPFPQLTTSLLTHKVDVQLIAGAIPHRTVRSTPVAAVPRVAAVPVRGSLSGAEEVRVDDLVELPMLYDPEVPDEFMRPFWLGDLRPAQQARLVSVVARDSRTVLEHVVRAAGVTVLLASQTSTAPDGVCVLPLLGAAPLVLHAATRADDRRAAVRSLVGALQAALSYPAGRSPQPGVDPMLGP